MRSFFARQSGRVTPTTINTTKSPTFTAVRNARIAVAADDEDVSGLYRTLSAPDSQRIGNSHEIVTPTGITELCPSPIRRMNSTEEFHQELRDIFERHFLCAFSSADLTKSIEKWMLTSSPHFQELLDGFTEITFNAYLQMELPWYKIDTANDYAFHCQENEVSFSIGFSLYDPLSTYMYTQCFLSDLDPVSDELFNSYHSCYYLIDDNKLMFKEYSKSRKNVTEEILSINNDQKGLIQKLLADRKILEAQLSRQYNAQEIEFLKDAIMNLNDKHVRIIQSLISHTPIVKTEPMTPEEFTKRFNLFTSELCKETFEFLNLIIMNNSLEYLKRNGMHLLVNAFRLAFKKFTEGFQESSIDYFDIHLPSLSAEILSSSEAYIHSEQEVFKKNELDLSNELSEAVSETDDVNVLHERLNIIKQSEEVKDFIKLIQEIAECELELLKLSSATKKSEEANATALKFRLALLFELKNELLATPFVIEYKKILQLLNFEQEHSLRLIKLEEQRNVLEAKKELLLLKWENIIAKVQDYYFINSYIQELDSSLVKKESYELDALNAKTYNEAEFNYNPLSSINKLRCLFQIFLTEHSLEEQSIVIKKSYDRLSQQLDKEKAQTLKNSMSSENNIHTDNSAFCSKPRRHRRGSFINDALGFLSISTPAPEAPAPIRKTSPAKPKVLSERQELISKSAEILSTRPGFFSPINSGKSEKAANELSDDLSDLSPIYLTK